ncbi:Tetratricopeptide repeat-containing protein [Persephonella hydrogeniphila]|uniref:Tetratricopeptide repeat-containing protein n=1 Tax=Persephonella hydrogeniphila TaxID=198703 RepID=A0A285NPH1_9AQUI|nr:tetratricopeptide repeat protein [Persephonella hydrogeniphila]SNZ11412.1 Tetratricopeptide repeat-containing protein [Persephonella hydrogeniphila]
MNRVDILKRALEKDPDNPLGLYGLALELFKERRYDEAILYLHRYLDLHEDEGAAYRLLAQSYLNIGDIEKAIEFYQKGIEQAKKFNHSSMVEEYRQEIENLKEMI